MESKNMFGGPRTLLTVALVVVIVAVVAAIATLVVRAALGDPEGPPPSNSAGVSVSVSML